MVLGALLTTVVAGPLLYALYGAIYRLYLSPVAKFPGPKLAALTFWYEFYFDMVKQGAYVYEIERMHDKYGPIVRINPYELHVRDNDIDFMNRLYPSVGKEVDKFWFSAGMFGSTEMTFGTIHHGVHRMRRDAFGKFFSPAYVRRLQPTLKAIITNMCAKVEAGVRAGKTINLVHAFSALTQDIITEYCFADSRGVVDMDDFAPQYYEWMQIQCILTPVIKQFPKFLPTLNLLPDWWMRATSPMAYVFRVQERLYADQIQKVRDGGDDKSTHVTVFHELCNDPELPPQEKTITRLVAEANSIVGAGTLTTAHVLSLTTFWLLKDPVINKKLRDELAATFLDSNNEPDLATLEKLPYLTAVVDEGLRMSYGIMHRLARVHPKSTIQYREWTIPPNTPVGMTGYFLHMDKELFPNPRTFDPERWLKLDAAGRERQLRYLFNFGKGSRQCVGMRLAYAEMYLTFAHFMHRLGDVQLFDTEYERDVEYVKDFFIPLPSSESRGVRIVKA